LDAPIASSSNHRASLALLLGLASVLTLPAGIVLAQRSPTISLLDVAWAIPAAIALGGAALATSNLAKARVQRTLGRAGGEGRLRAARILGIIGLCLAITAAISVGFYEILLQYEK
jgi:hypothetical protein